MIFARQSGLPKVSPELRGEQVLYVDTTDLVPDAVTLDILARFALQVRRSGYRVVLRGVSPELAELIEFAGLEDALPVDPLGPDPLRPDSSPPRC
jgi:anti-anti-sigma regulatory factor